MLQAFEGIIDASGLCSLQQDGTKAVSRPLCGGNQVPIWEVLDTSAATQVLRELIAGNRRRALTLLETAAVSLGSK